ncbi:hypothetical protein [uncultured Aquimarina sp.]|uniref:hypothetical protein n=1 Tax=uncultured Aquimarina sp. TaxID=575652 RepID=UPI0026102FFE|nr:hypothetical protein [uncultured Aquimarina sp.]
MKLKNLAFIFLIVFYSCDTEENDFEELINEDSIPFITAISNLENKNGIIITENTVVFTEDLTIPEGVILNFNVRDRMIINSGITVTINGIISAGKFKIFEIANGGKVNGCPQIEYIIPQWWGTDDTGLGHASDNFQMAIESFDCIKKFVSSGKFLLDKEILLNIDERNYDFTGSHFLGTEEGTLFGAGGLVTIGDRNFDIDENYSVENVTVHGGTYQPKNNHDNSLAILNAKNIKISDVTIIGEEGLRGIALQTPGSHLVNNPIIENIIIENVFQEGGVNVFNIDLNNGLVKNVIVKNIIGTSIDEDNPQLDEDGNVRGKEAAFRCSSQGDVLRIKNVTISDVILENVHIGFELRGMKADISNVQMNHVSYRGIVTQYADIINLNDITIIGKSNITEGIVTLGSPTVLTNSINLNGLTLKGKFKNGITNQVEGINGNNIFIDAEVNTGIHNISSNVRFNNTLIKNSSNLYYHSAIYNHNSAINSQYRGTIEGNFDHGFINAAKSCVVDFQMNGSFKNGAIFTFYNDTGYSSLYKGFINFTDSDSKHINQYRADDIYELYVYNLLTSDYDFNP